MTNEDIARKGSDFIVTAVIVAVGSVYLMLLYGFILKVFWGWFVVPMFGLAQLSIVQAIGLMLVAMAMYSPPMVKEPKKPDVLGIFFTRPLTVLAVGWVVQMFL